MQYNQPADFQFKLKTEVKRNKRTTSDKKNIIVLFMCVCARECLNLGSILHLVKRLGRMHIKF